MPYCKPLLLSRTQLVLDMHKKGHAVTTAALFLAANFIHASVSVLFARAFYHPDVLPAAIRWQSCCSARYVFLLCLWLCSHLTPFRQCRAILCACFASELEVNLVYNQSL
jgi:hypothetical protein